MTFATTAIDTAPGGAEAQRGPDQKWEHDELDRSHQRQMEEGHRAGREEQNRESGTFEEHAATRRESRAVTPDEQRRREDQPA